MKRRRKKGKNVDRKLINQMREAADHGHLVATFERMMENLMSDNIPIKRCRNQEEVEKLRLGIALQLSLMANSVAEEKGLNLSFIPFHPTLIFSNIGYPHYYR